MKKTILFCLLLFSFSTYAQDEFLENNGGISLAGTYGHMPGITNIASMGIAVRSAKGLSIAAEITSTDNYVSPSVGIGYFTAPKEKNNYLSLAFGLSYAYINSQSLIGMTTGPMLYLNAKKQFPTSINGRLSCGFDLSSAGNGYGYVPNNTNISFGAGVHQAFFSDARVFPYLCFNFSYSPKKSNPSNFAALYAITLGINLSKK